MVGEDTWQREKQQPSDDKRERERERKEREEGERIESSRHRQATLHLPGCQLELTGREHCAASNHKKDVEDGGTNNGSKPNVGFGKEGADEGHCQLWRRPTCRHQRGTGNVGLDSKSFLNHVKRRDEKIIANNGKRLRVHSGVRVCVCGDSEERGRREGCAQEDVQP